MTRCKFKLDEIRRIQTNVAKQVDGKTVYAPGEMRSFVFSPVYANNDPNHENSKFWAASPSGRFELGCVNLAAVEGFELGREYYIDISAA